MTAKTTQKQTQTDSLFGMALAQAFMGCAFGLGVDMAWEACEITSAVYEDRVEATSNTIPTYHLGCKKALGNSFESRAHNVIDLEKPFASFGYERRLPFTPAHGFSMAA